MAVRREVRGDLVELAVEEKRGALRSGRENNQMSAFKPGAP
jgi:hypothetical protein